MPSKLKLNVVVADVNAIDAVLQRVQQSGLSGEVTIRVGQPDENQYYIPVQIVDPGVGSARYSAIQGL
jgi:hypothetical protein